jgi:hypothetical protein
MGGLIFRKPFMAVKPVQMVTQVLHALDRSQIGNEFDTRKDMGSQ